MNNEKLDSLLASITEDQDIPLKRTNKFLVNDLAETRLRFVELYFSNGRYEKVTTLAREVRDEIVAASGMLRKWLGHENEAIFREEYPRIIAKYNEAATRYQAKGIKADLIDPKLLGLG